MAYRVTVNTNCEITASKIAYVYTDITPSAESALRRGHGNVEKLNSSLYETNDKEVNLTE